MKARFLIVALAAIFAAIMAYAPPQLAAQIDITQGPVLESVSDHSAVVAWSTNKDGSTVLNYGTDPRNLAQVAEAPWGAYPTSCFPEYGYDGRFIEAYSEAAADPVAWKVFWADRVVEPPWGANGHTHRVELRNLRPNTTYYFRVETGQTRGGNGAAVDTQGVISFRTQPEGAPPIHERPR